MKKFGILCMLGLALVACGGNAKHSVSADDTRKEVAVQDGVEVLYFHGKQAVPHVWPSNRELGK